MSSVLDRRPLLSATLLALPVVATAGLAATMRPEARSLLAPVLGPWAGMLYGHSDCTMGNALPFWSGTAATLLAIGLASLTTSGRWRHPTLALVAPSVGLLAWCVLALMSVLNTLS